MPKIFIPILIFLFAFSTLAQADNLPDAGLTLDSPFYFLKAWKETIQTFFTFGEENKAKQYLHLADVRLAEYQKMVEKGKTEIAQKTLDKYEKQLNRALDKAKELQEKGKDVKDLSQKLEQTISKHLEVLQKNLQKVPEAAKKGIEKAIENSSEAIKRVSGQKLCAKEGKMCGGIAGIQCCSGLKCQLQGNYPDASGTCVKEGEKVTETCEADKEYQHTAVKPIECQCPQGYEFKVIEMGWGPCPEAGMSDCPASTVKCVKN